MEGDEGRKRTVRWLLGMMAGWMLGQLMADPSDDRNKKNPPGAKSRAQERRCRLHGDGADGESRELGEVEREDGHTTIW